MQDKTKIKLWAISMIAGLEAIALVMGYNGVTLSVVIALIAGLAGYQVGVKTT